MTIKNMSKEASEIQEQIATCQKSLQADCDVFKQKTIEHAKVLNTLLDSKASADFSYAGLLAPGKTLNLQQLREVAKLMYSPVFKDLSSDVFDENFHKYTFETNNLARKYITIETPADSCEDAFIKMMEESFIPALDALKTKITSFEIKKEFMIEQIMKSDYLKFKTVSDVLNFYGENLEKAKFVLNTVSSSQGGPESKFTGRVREAITFGSSYHGSFDHRILSYAKTNYYSNGWDRKGIHISYIADEFLIEEIKNDASPHGTIIPIFWDDAVFETILTLYDKYADGLTLQEVVETALTI